MLAGGLSSLLTLQGDSDPYHIDLSTELLEYPHDMVADFPPVLQDRQQGGNHNAFLWYTLGYHHPFCSILLIKNESLSMVHSQQEGKLVSIFFKLMSTIYWTICEALCYKGLLMEAHEVGIASTSHREDNSFRRISRLPLITLQGRKSPSFKGIGTKESVNLRF